MNKRPAKRIILVLKASEMLKESEPTFSDLMVSTADRVCLSQAWHEVGHQLLKHTGLLVPLERNEIISEILAPPKTLSKRIADNLDRVRRIIVELENMDPNSDPSLTECLGFLSFQEAALVDAAESIKVAQ